METGTRHPDTSPLNELLALGAQRTRDALQRNVDHAARAYVRERDLARLVAAWPFEIYDLTVVGSERVIEKLHEQARCLTRLARRRHWTYDLNRHIAILGALQAEQARLVRLRSVAA